MNRKDMIFMPDEFFENEVDRANAYIEMEAWEDLLDWAIDHNDNYEDTDVSAKVMEAYKICQEHEETREAASLNLGVVYYKGLLTEQNYPEAFKLFSAAAETGNIRAITNVGYCYFHGRGVKKDFKKAYEAFTMGALLGNDANCLYKLGDMYYNGDYVQRSDMYAFTLYDRAFNAANLDENGNGDDRKILPDIFFRLGICYFNGVGTEKNCESALKLFSDALFGFYLRRKTDPSAAHLIKECKNYIKQIEKELDESTLEVYR